MARLPIIELPDKRLKQVCEPIEAVTDEIRTLVSDMAETMYAVPGIGLAASQVGVLKRLIVCDVAGKDEPPALYVLINPEIVRTEGEAVAEEGCLSVPGVFEDVKRFRSVEMAYLDLEGLRKTLTAEGMLSVCLQHELDHLNGVLFTDHLSSLKRQLALRKVKRFQAERARKEAEAAEGGGTPERTKEEPGAHEQS